MVKKAFYKSKRTFCDLRKREDVHSELADSVEKMKLLRERFSFRNLNYDGKQQIIMCELKIVRGTKTFRRRITDLNKPAVELLLTPLFVLSHLSSFNLKVKNQIHITISWRMEKLTRPRKEQWNMRQNICAKENFFLKVWWRHHRRPKKTITEITISRSLLYTELGKKLYSSTEQQ